MWAEVTGAGLPADDGGVGTEGSRVASLYEEHARWGIRLAYVLTGDADLAEDLLQDAFVKVIGRLGDLRSAGAFEAYLRRTIVNLSYSTFRRRRVERSYLQQERAALTRPEPNPVDLAERDELWRSLSRLAPRQRAALVLRFYEDLSERETAQVMGCSLRSAKSLAARGLQALRVQQTEQAR